ncbi:oxygenase MpaB family protein [Streptomyces sp. TS71-3]|uniref:oxygenase MpaB family protein n=1 Tax=Streptomyces sp. TS71-3 TaxID=2733862 RepID=UPI001BB3A287|nr:oxygenase MpaB family protein [Streptomyces sp. TS71-3]
MRVAHGAYARLVLETMPEESRVGLTLGFVRTFGIADIARVLHGTGRMTGDPRGRAKATGVAMFALIGQGLDSAEGRKIVEGLRRVHDRPGITPELMHYVLACFTICPLRFIDRHGHRPVTDAERDAALTFHLSLSKALGLPEPPGGHTTVPLAGVESWMRDYESRHFAPSAEGQALWQSTSRGLLAARLPAPLAPLAPALAASLLDQPLRTALNVRRPPAPVRALVTYALRFRARARAGH